MARTKKSRAPKKAERQKVTPPPQGDIGPDTPAQRDGATVLHFTEANGAKFQRKRRDHLLSRMQSRRQINSRQAAAGIELCLKYEATLTSPPSAFTRDFVDSSPKPDDVAVMQLEAKDAFTRLYTWVPRNYRYVVEHVVFQERPIRGKQGLTDDWREALQHTACLQVALDLVADAMMLR